MSGKGEKLQLPIPYKETTEKGVIGLNTFRFVGEEDIALKNAAKMANAIRLVCH